MVGAARPVGADRLKPGVFYLTGCFPQVITKLCYHMLDDLERTPVNYQKKHLESKFISSFALSPSGFK